MEETEFSQFFHMPSMITHAPITEDADDPVRMLVFEKLDTFCDEIVELKSDEEGDFQRLFICAKVVKIHRPQKVL